MLVLPITSATCFILVRPHYPENVGASARALKTMGITQLALVKPGRLAQPEHEMAFRMAVRSWDVLEAATVHTTLSEALRGADLVFATSARRGRKGQFNPREAARLAVAAADRGERIAVVLGNEKTGLDKHDASLCPRTIRIPMAADQPSINLAQTCQVLAYEWFMAGLEARCADVMSPGNGVAAPEATTDGEPS